MINQQGNQVAEFPHVWKPWHYAALGLAVLGYLGLFVISAGGLRDHDCFVMGAVAQYVLEGKTLYGEVWDNKPPLALLFYAIPSLLFPRSYVAMQTFLGLWLLAQAGLFVYLLRGQKFAFRAMGAALLLLLPLSRLDFSWASSEHATNLFTLVVILLAYRLHFGTRLSWCDCLAAGACVSLAFHCRQTAVLFGALPVWALLVRPETVTEKGKGLLVYAAGGLLGLAAVLLLVLACGDIHGYWYTVFEAPRKYGLGLKHGILLLWPLRMDVLALLLAGGCYLAATARHAWFAIPLALTAIAVVVAPCRPYDHYWAQAFPAVAVLVFVALASAAEQPARGLAGARSFLGRGAMGLLIFLAANAVLTALWLNRMERPRRVDYDQIIARLEATARPGDTLFAMGRDDAYFYFASRLPPAHTFFWRLFFRPGIAEVLPRPVSEVLQEYRSSPPTLLALEADIRDRLRDTKLDPAADDARIEGIIQDLVRSPAYREVEEINGFVILQRE